MAKPFADVIAIDLVRPNVYITRHPLDKEWSVGSVPNGGYTASLIGAAAVLHSLSTSSRSSDPKGPFSGQPHLLNLSLQYLRRTYAGHHAMFTVRNVKLGARLSVIHLSLTQEVEGETSLIEGYATLGNLLTEEGVTVETSRSFLNPKPLPVDLRLLERDGEDGMWKAVTERPKIGFRRSSQHVLLHSPKKSKLVSQNVSSLRKGGLAKKAVRLGARGQDGNGNPEDDDWRSVVDVWVRFTPFSCVETSSPMPKPERWTNAALPYLVDNFPLPLEQILSSISSDIPMYWYPTLSLHLDVKSLLPPEGVDWLFVRARAKVIRNGRMDIDVTVLDEAGKIIATATHAALVSDVGKNTAGRGQKDNTQNGKL